VQLGGDLPEVLHGLLNRLLGEADLGGGAGGVDGPVDLGQRELLVGDADAVPDAIMQFAGDAAALVLLRLVDLVEQEAVVAVGGLPDPLGQALLQAADGQRDDVGGRFVRGRDPAGQMAQRRAKEK
jgi:hypothetical protein